MFLILPLRSGTILKTMMLACFLASCEPVELPDLEGSLSGLMQPTRIVPAGQPRMTPVHPDSVTTIFAKGESFYTERPVITPANTNVHPAGTPRLIPRPDSLPVITPGKDGVPLPKTQAVRGRRVLARHPKPVIAMPPAFRDNAVIDVQYLDQDKGLSASTILAIEEDQDGNLWFGTEGGGISRYDGSRFFHYTQEEGLASMQVFDILKDSQGYLWLANAVGGGLTRYDGTNFIHFGEDEGLATRVVYDILEDRQGHIWVATEEAGVVMYDGESFTYYTKKEGLPDDTVFSILEDSRGHLWFSTEKEGLTRYDGIRFTSFPNLKESHTTLVSPMLEDSRGELWFTSTSGYLLKYDGTDFWRFPRAQEWRPHFFISIVEDGQGDLWLGTRGAGVCHFDGRQFTYYSVEEGLTSNSILALQRDSRGTIWVGTDGGGVIKLNPGGFQQIGSDRGLGGNPIRTILEDRKGHLWMGNQAGEIINYDGRYFRRYTLKKGRDRRVISAIEDRQGNIWLGSFGEGLLRIEPTEGSGPLRGTQYARLQGLPSHDLELIREDSQGNIWMGTFEGGLMKFNGQFFTHYTTKDGLGSNSVISMLEDSQGNLWFGTYGGGVTRFDGERFAVFSEAEGLSHNIVRTIFEDSHRNLWFGTEGGGLNHYDGKYFSHYQLDEHQNAGHIRSIQEDPNGNFWFTTMNGLYYARVKPGDSFKGTGTTLSDTMKAPVGRIIRFDRADGLKGLDFLENSVCLSSSDQLWWGTKRSLTMLPLDRFQLTDQPPHVQLTGILLNQRFVDFQDTNEIEKFHLDERNCVPFFNYPLNLEVPHFANSLTFQYSAINRDAPSGLVYRYLLEGYDKNWSLASANNEVEYRNLPHGEYTFRVMAKRETGRWSEPVAYRFLIHPPWWQTWWAYSFYVLLFLGILYLIRQYELKRRQIKHQKEIEMARLEEQSKQAVKLLELDEMKSRFFTNISHEFRTPLTIISGMVTQIKNHPDRWLTKGMELIQRNSNHLLSLINQILDLRKLESGALKPRFIQADIIPYLHYIAQSFRPVAQFKGIKIHVLSNLKALQMDYDQEKMMHILSNLISNAIKYTPGEGDIYLQIDRYSDSGTDWLRLQIKDTGQGIKSEHLPHIFDRFYQVEDLASQKAPGSGIGLAYTKELVHLLNGFIEVSSEWGVGSTFTLAFPITQNARIQESQLEIEANPQENEAYSSPPGEEMVSTDPALKMENPEKVVGNALIPDLLPTLLIVEDNPDVRLYLSSCLANDYTLLLAENGQEGIDIAIEQVPDLIVSDVMMPVKDGYELCDTLKNDERTSHIPVILLTAKADFDSKMSGLKKGADAYLTKPFKEEELLVRLEQLLILRKKLQDRYKSQLEAPQRSSSGKHAMEDVFIQKFRQLVNDNITEEDFGVVHLCRSLSVSRTQLHNKIKALTDLSTTAFVRSIRLHKARHLLQTTDLNISEVGYEVGINNPAYFSRIYSEEFGEAPRRTRK